MSSLPGYTLEDYVEWQHDLIVDDKHGVNMSLDIAETLGVSTRRRPTITKEQYAPILALYEPYRDQVEDKLLDFDEENQSWRSYAGCAFGFIPESVWNEANAIRTTLIEELTDATSSD